VKVILPDARVLAPPSPPTPPDLAGTLTKGNDTVDLMQIVPASERVEDFRVADGGDPQMSTIARPH
jgi:hypothetical protein